MGRERIQKLVKTILSGKIDLPVSNPSLQLIDEYDAAKSLYELPLRKIRGPINIASDKILCAEEICYFIAKHLNTDLKITWSSEHESSPFDLIKFASKTLCLIKQHESNLSLKNAYDILLNIISASVTFPSHASL